MSRAPDRCHACGEVGHRSRGCGIDHTITKEQRWVLRQRFAGRCLGCGDRLAAGRRLLRCEPCTEGRRQASQARRDALRARGLNSRGLPLRGAA